MKVFISWSGEASGNLAEVLRQWIPGVIQAVKPYYSSGDVAKGARWTSEIAKELEESRVGLICLTRENLEAPWLIFEAGALSKSLDKSRVCPILFDLEPTDLKGPLAQFQASKFQKNEIKRVMKTINAELGENALPDDVLDSVFDMWWPRLEERVQEELEKQDVSESKRVRSERDLLEEILQLSRLQSNSSQQAYSFHPKIIDKLLEAHEAMIRDTKEGNLPSASLKALEEIGESLSHLVRSLPMSSNQKKFAMRVDQARFDLKDSSTRRDEMDIHEEDFDDIPF